MGFKKRVAAAAVAVAAAGAVAVGLPASSTAAMTPSLSAFGILQNGTVMCAFKTDNPGELNWVRSVSGLTGNDTALIGIDFRVQDGKLYGVGNYGGVYTITTPTGASDPVKVTKVSQLQVALSGSKFGVDFNPAANRLRIISDNGQNLRHDVVGGVTNVDKNLPQHGVTAAAYTNNDLNSDTATTLFDIDTVNDQVVIQSLPNDGTLAPTGKLGVPFDVDAGADIYSDLYNGKTQSNTGFATAMDKGIGTFLSFDALTGAGSVIGIFPLPVTDVAVALDTN